MVRKIFKKYPKDLKPIENVPKEWDGFKRNDYAKWNRRDILLGAFLRFPLNISHIVMLLVCLSGIPVGLLLNAISGKLFLGNIFYYRVTRRISMFILRYFTTIKIIEEG